MDRRMNGEFQQYCIHALAKRLRVLPASLRKGYLAIWIVGAEIDDERPAVLA